jgi:transcriptional regulator with XRE-family HTH domain
MNNNINLLKRYRKRSPLTQTDVATLLGIDQPNLARYETEKRLPTPEVLLTYHILFEPSLTELLHPLNKKVISNLLRRSQRLLPKINIMESPKSKHRIAYLNNLVKELITKQNNDK